MIVTTDSDYKDLKLVIPSYVDGNWKIVSASQTYTSTNNTIKIIYVTSYTVSTTASCMSAFFVYIDWASYSKSFLQNLSQSRTVVVNMTFKP